MRPVRRHPGQRQHLQFLGESCSIPRRSRPSTTAPTRSTTAPCPCHVHFVLDEFAAMPLPGFTRELATMRSRNISASTIIQNMAQIKELYKDSWETIPGNSDTILYLGGNEASTHKYISEALGKATIDTTAGHGSEIRSHPAPGHPPYGGRRRPALPPPQYTAAAPPGTVPVSAPGQRPIRYRKGEC